MLNNKQLINSLRPNKFCDFIGQKEIIDSLKIFVEAIKKRGFPNDHLLLYGPPGTGKTTLAYLIANELHTQTKITTGAALTKTGDLAAILTSLKDNEIFFIDEIHRLPKPVEEMLYSVLEDYHLDIVIGKGPSARIINLSIPKILIIGSTTKLAVISAPLRDRFGLTLRLNYYQEEEIMKIVYQAAKKINLPVSEKAAHEIAIRSRKIPRVALKILKRAKDLYDVKKIKVIDESFIDNLFGILKMNPLGLNPIDLEYLEVLYKKFNNQPVGLSTIAVSLSEEEKTIEEFIEPYLLRLGLIKKTPKGRVLTQKGLSYLGQIKLL